MHTDHKHIQTAAASEESARKGLPLIVWDAALDAWHAPLLPDFDAAQRAGWRDAEAFDFEAGAPYIRVVYPKVAEDLVTLAALTRSRKPGRDVGVYRLSSVEGVQIAVRPR
jgi:hypothetical protein